MKKKVMLSILGALCVAGSAQANSTDFAHWLVRLRGIAVIPETSTNTITPIGGHIHTSNQIVPELDFSYFFTQNISAALILATSRHSLKADDTTLGNVDLGKVTLLPPTLLAQYHFMPTSRISPYVGVGINYTYFYDIKNGPTLTSTKYGDSVGPALQVGADVAINDRWVFNVDAKKVFITSHVTTLSGATTVSTNAALNPWIVGAGFGYRFA